MFSISYFAKCILFLIIFDLQAVSGVKLYPAKVVLNRSEYCHVNESAIRMKTGGGLMILIKDIGDRVMMKNGSDL